MNNIYLIPDSKILGKLIKKIRTTNNLTQKAFGLLLKPSVTQSTVARWEKGEQTPDFIHFLKIASMLNLSLEEFIELVNESTLVDDFKIENKTLTYNKRHLSILKKGVTVWNNWREKHPKVIPQLSGISLVTGELDNLDRYNLQEANLAGFKGHGLQMNQANLVKANLEKAQLEESSFFGSDFSGANLNNIEIKASCFERAIFNESNLSKANVLDSNFKETSFKKAFLKKIVFSTVDLTGAILKQTNLESSQFINIKLSEANLNQASLKEANLSQCSVYGSTFIQTNLENVRIKNIFISPDSSFTGLPINNLDLAQYTYLQRYNTLVIQKLIKHYNLEIEIVKYSKLLIEKYGKYKYQDESSFFSFSKDLSINYPSVNVVKNNTCLYTEIISSFNNRDLIESNNPNCRRILQVNNNFVESSFTIEDFNILKRTFEYIQEEQKDKFIQAVLLAQKILNFSKKKKFADRNYTIEQTHCLIIICQLSNDSEEKKIEIARSKMINNQVEMVRSSLHDNHLINLQEILLNFVM